MIDLRVESDELRILEALASMPKGEGLAVGMTEDKIMGRLGMSLGTVRSSVGTLEEQGLVLSEPISRATEDRFGASCDATQLTTAGEEALRNRRLDDARERTPIRPRGRASAVAPSARRAAVRGF